MSTRQRLMALGGVAALIAIGAGILAATRDDDGIGTDVLGVQFEPTPTAAPFVSQPPNIPIPPPVDVPNVPPVTRTPPPGGDTTTTTTTRTTTTVTTVTPAPLTPRNASRPNPINCADEAQRQFCTAQESMKVTGGNLENRASSQVARREGFPTFIIDASPTRSDGQPAKVGEKVSTLKIKLTLVNETNKNFIVPEGDLAVKMKRDGKDVSLPVQKQGQFEMRPGAKLEAIYDIPIFEDGTYSYYGETFFYDA